MTTTRKVSELLGEGEPTIERTEEDKAKFSQDMARIAKSLSSKGKFRMQPAGKFRLQLGEGEQETAAFGCIIRSNGDGTITFHDPTGEYVDSGRTIVGHAGISYQKAKDLADLISDAPTLAHELVQARAQIKLLREACKKARSCASLPDSVKDLLRAALAQTATEAKQ